MNIFSGSRALRYLLRIWGQGGAPSEDDIEIEAENFTTTPLMKHIQAGNVIASDTGIAVYKHYNLPNHSLGFPDVHLPRKGSIPFSRKWIALLIGNAKGTHTPFGITMTQQQVMNLISNIPEIPMPIPSSTLDTIISSEILVSNDTWAVPTVSGWKFRAGEVLRAKKHVWSRICAKEVSHKIFNILHEGWNPPMAKYSQPVWFQEHAMTTNESAVWGKEVTTLLQMGSISQITQQHVLRFGLPQVVLPIFLVEEKDKFRPIIDARFSNLGFLPPWFPLPDITHFLQSLTRDTFWFKCDIKGGWHHIPIHQHHSNFFAFHWEGKLFQYTVCPFGDATAPYCFTYLLITLKRMLKARGFHNFTLYIDDLLLPGSTSLQTAIEMRSKVIAAQLELNLVLGAKKCPLPSRQGEALGFWVDTKKGIVTFTEEKLQKIHDLASVLSSQWKNGKKVAVKNLASILGKIISGKILFEQTIGLLHPLLDLLAKSTANNNWDNFVAGPPHLLDNIFDWINFVRSNPRRLWFSPTVNIYFSSDATLDAASAVFWGFTPEFSPSTKPATPILTAHTNKIPPSDNIAAIEAFAITWGFETLLPDVLKWLQKLQLQFSQVNWVWATDNQVCEGSFNKGRSKQQLVHKFTQECLKKWILPMSLHISFPYIPSKINYYADHISRLPPFNQWIISPKYFAVFAKFSAKHNLPCVQCDAFASRKTAVTFEFCSPFLDTGACSEFFSNKSQQHKVFWISPPWDLYQEIFHFICTQGITAWVLLPVWPGASWWHWTSFAKSRFDIKFKPELGQICFPSSPSVRNSSAWNYAIFLFQRSQVSYRENKEMP